MITNSSRRLYVIHIGKCGGSSIRDLIRSSPSLAERYTDIKLVHTTKPKYGPRADYLIIIRNPLARLISAFYWRHRLTHEKEGREERIKGESAVFNKYSDLNLIAEDLYSSNNQINTQAHNDLKNIHHIREDISFYLSSLLDQVSPHNVYGVICTERMDIDCRRLLGVTPKNRRKDNWLTPKPALTKAAVRNLIMFLNQDFACVERMFRLNLLDESQYQSLSNVHIQGQ